MRTTRAAFAVAFGTTYSGGDFVTDAHMSLVDSSVYFFPQWFDVFTPPLYRITSGGAQYVKDFGKKEGLNADDQAAFAVAFDTTYSGWRLCHRRAHVRSWTPAPTSSRNGLTSSMLPTDALGLDFFLVRKGVISH